jgi:periplasmic divalent cation tolerance protein
MMTDQIAGIEIITGKSFDIIWPFFPISARSEPTFMKSAAKFALVLVTAPDLAMARRLAQAALKARLVACANLIPKIESHYWWQEKIETGEETLLLLKTAKTRLRALEKLVLALHPYNTPEFLVLPLTAGNDRYLKWLQVSVRA